MRLKSDGSLTKRQNTRFVQVLYSAPCVSSWPQRAKHACRPWELAGTASTSYVRNFLRSPAPSHPLLPTPPPPPQEFSCKSFVLQDIAAQRHRHHRIVRRPHVSWSFWQAGPHGRATIAVTSCRAASALRPPPCSTNCALSTPTHSRLPFLLAFSPYAEPLFPMLHVHHRSIGSGCLSCTDFSEARGKAGMVHARGPRRA